jgi:hypothetical protein
MPYKRVGKCVFKKQPNGKLSEKPVGCSDSVEKAKSYLKALYSAETLNESLSPEVSRKAKAIFKAIINDRGDKLYDKMGPEAVEDFIYATAINKAKQSVEKNNTEMDQKLKEAVKSTLSKYKSASFSKEYDDQFSDKRKNLPDALQKSILKKQGKLGEDLDIGHEDNEPHMVKAELYQIGKYAMDLYKMMGQFEGDQEVDFPAWLQSKITTAKNMMSGVKHYLEFELKEPEIDAMVDIIDQEDIIEWKRNLNETQVKNLTVGQTYTWKSPSKEDTVEYKGEYDGMYHFESVKSTTNYSTNAKGVEMYIK